MTRGLSASFDLAELKGATIALHTFDADTRKTLAARQRTLLRPLWVDAVRRAAATPRTPGRGRQDARAVGKGYVTMNSAGKGSLQAYPRPQLTNGAYWPMIEYGAKGTRGQEHLPAHIRGGRMVAPIIPRWTRFAVRMWLGVLTDAVRDATGGD